MAEGRDNEYFSSFNIAGENLDDLLKADDEARLDNVETEFHQARVVQDMGVRAARETPSQDIRIIDERRPATRGLRVGERIDLGHRNVAESAVFPLSEREIVGIPVNEEVVIGDLSLAPYLYPPPLGSPDTSPVRPAAVLNVPAASPEVLFRDGLAAASGGFPVEPRRGFPLEPRRGRGMARAPRGRAQQRRTSSPIEVEMIGV